MIGRIAIRLARCALVSASVTAIVAASAPAAAQQEARAFDIPAQPLSSAILEFSRQSEVMVLLAPELAEGRRSHTVRGTMPASLAIARLLTGTGLQAIPNPSGGYRIVRRGEGSESPTLGEGEAGGAAADSVSANSAATPEILVVGRSLTLNADIRRTENDTQPYVVLPRAEIEQSGAQNVEQLLRQRMTAASSGISSAQLSGPTGTASSFALRGLNPTETLVLIDGRRASGFAIAGSPQQPDVNAIPVSAIERIEILPSSASGIYGGSATGGVINIILRRDYRGLEVRTSYGAALDGEAPTWSIAATGGFSFNDGRTNVQFRGSYLTSDPLLQADRDFYDRAVRHVLRTSPSFYFGNTAQPPLGSTTNIAANFVAGLGVRPDLTLRGTGQSLGAPFVFIPPGYQGIAEGGAGPLVDAAGRFNFALADTAQRGGGRESLLAGSRVWSVAASIRQEIGNALTGFIDVSASENRGTFDRGVVSATFSLPATSAANPFNEAITITTPAFGADGRFVTRLRDYRLTAGLIFRLGEHWRGELDYVLNQTRYSASQPAATLDSAAVLAAINNGALNLFRDTNLHPVDFSPYLFRDSFTEPQSTKLHDLSLRIAGPLPARLPGGSATMTALAEYRSEHFGEYVSTSFQPGGATQQTIAPERRQEATSVYTELRLPVLAGAAPGDPMLELSAALRADFYRSVGANVITVRNGTVIGTAAGTGENEFRTVNPTLGLRFKPIADVTFRASYATGFLPPALNQFVPTTTIISAAVAASLRLTDPERGGEIIGSGTGFTLIGGGNPDLEPERSQSYSAGLIVTPRFIPGLRLSVDWSRIKKRDNIVLPLATNQAGFEELLAFSPERITRGAPSDGFAVGPITRIDQSFLNLSRAEVEAWDFGLDYRRQTESLGTFTITLGATHQVDLTQQRTAVAPVIENAGTIAGLDWRGYAAFGWEFRRFSVAWTVNYFSGYDLFNDQRLLPIQGISRIPSQTYHDLALSYRFGRLLVSEEPELRLVVRNIFNRRPPLALNRFAQGEAFAYSSLGDPRRGSFLLSLRLPM